MVSIATQGILDKLQLPVPITDVVFLDKGYSTDRKFVLHTRVGPAYLLRISDAQEVALRRSQYDALVQVHAAGVACPEPVAFGIDEQSGLCYSASTYILGDCAEDALPGMSPPDRYDVGRQAGEQLLLLHAAVEPPHPVDDFRERSAKYERHRSEAAALGYDYPGREQAERYVEANLHLLKERPTTFRHGDYHPGNLIVDGPILAGVIDFNRCDFGDPVDDFYKTAWFGAPLSADYARGLIRAYFHGEPDESFWRLYNLYVAAVLPADLVWTHRFYPDQLARSFQAAELIARTHDFECGGPPTWWPNSDKAVVANRP